MGWMDIVLLIASPAVFWGVALVITAIFSKFYRRRCPDCGARGVKCVDFIITEPASVGGKRSPNCLSYYRCDICGQSFKLHDKRLEPVPSEEQHLLSSAPN